MPTCGALFHCIRGTPCALCQGWVGVINACCQVFLRGFREAGGRGWLPHVQTGMNTSLSGSPSYCLFVLGISKPLCLGSSRHIRFLQSCIPSSILHTVTLSTFHHLASPYTLAIFCRPVEISHLLWLPLQFSLLFQVSLKLLKQKA